MVFSLRHPETKAKQERWWKIGRVPISSNCSHTTFMELFEDSVKIRLRSDVRIGSCLSGGLDSSAIVMAMAGQLKGSPIDTITCCYDGAAFDERHYAEEVVAAAKSNPHWVMPQKKNLLSDDLLHLVAEQEKPFASLSVYSQYCVMREVRKAGITVLLDGQGGDELLLGYDFVQEQRLAFLVRSFQLPTALSLARKLCDKNPLFSPKRILLSVISNLMPRPRRGLNNRSNLELFNLDFASRHMGRCYPRLHTSFMDYRYSLVEADPLPPLLHHEDRNSMAFSIESRLPLLDYRLADFVFNISPDALMKDGWSKVYLRQYLDKAALPNVAWRREKMGFNTPTAKLIEQSKPFFQAACREMLRSERFVQPQKLLQLLDLGNIESRHWRFLSLELWMRSLDIS